MTPRHDPETVISERIAVLRCLLIFGIVMLHVPPYVPLAETGATGLDALKAFFQHAVFRCSVPVLTFMSGLLLFRAALDRRYPVLLRRKARTLLLPLVLFSLPVSLAVAGLQLAGAGGSGFAYRLDTLSPAVWADAVLGLTASPINYPLVFLRDLFVLALLAPVAGWLIRRAPWTGLALVSGLFWFNLDGDLVLRNIMPLMFYLGGMAAVHGWDLTRLDRCALPCLALFVVCCVAIVVTASPQLREALRLVSPLLVWPAAALLAGTAAARWLAQMSRYSLMTFVLQAPLLFAFWQAQQHALPGLPYPLFWLAAPVLVVAVAVVVQRLGWQCCPGLMSAMLGRRQTIAAGGRLQHGQPVTAGV